MATLSDQVTFEAFMADALHHPVHGYYANRIREFGHCGDFTTFPVLSGEFASAVANWAVAAMRSSNCRNLIEIGPGNGALAEAVLKCLPWSIRWRTRLHLVETSKKLTEIQKQRIGTGAHWFPNVAEALENCGGDAILFSNELIDAYPVRRFENTVDGWKEIAVSLTLGNAQEMLIESESLPDSTIFRENFAIGQRVEVHESYQRDLASWIPYWRSGRMLTVDYGALSPDLYLRRLGGSVRGYIFHQCLTGLEIYDRPGKQDLTADVNFSDLQHWSRPFVADQKLTTREFLKTHASAANGTLFSNEPMTEAFMALDQQRTMAEFGI